MLTADWRFRLNRSCSADIPIVHRAILAAVQQVNTNNRSLQMHCVLGCVVVLSYVWFADALAVMMANCYCI
jgi:hypothetical protein